MDGYTYMYNEGRERNVASGIDLPGVCNLSGCWCCKRKQRPLLQGDFYEENGVPSALALPKASPAASPEGFPAASPLPSPLPVPSPVALPAAKCDFTERFGNISTDVWRKYRPDFLLGRTHLRAQLGAPSGFRSCAVVGSSGKLLYKRHGNVIDDHEMVMRMNTAPTMGFVNHTGGRTTHRMVATTAFEEMMDEHKCSDDGKKCLLNGHAPEWCPVGAMILNSFLEDNKEKAKANARLHPQYIEFMKTCGSLVSRDSPMGRNAREIAHKVLTTKKSHFMTGLAGLLMAAMLCDEGFDIYGYDTGDEPEGTLYHFYDEVEVNKKDDFKASKAFFKAFVQAQPHCFRNHD
jgi:hypothetical protein